MEEGSSATSNVREVTDGWKKEEERKFIEVYFFFLTPKFSLPIDNFVSI